MATRRAGVAHAWQIPRGALNLQLDRTALRELRRGDAVSLAPLLDDPEIERFMPGAPTTSEAFREFTAWASRQRRRGGHLCLAVTVDERAIGLIQAWPLEPRAQTVEWGFAIGRPYWGRSLFHEAARAFVSLAIERLGVRRLEARMAVANQRGMAAIIRLGARPEGVLRRSFSVGDTREDSTLWSILSEEWAGSVQQATATSGEPPHRPALVIAP